MEMGKYCKAYYAKDFRALESWEENPENLRPESRDEGGKENEVATTGLEDDDILYLQENYVVTDGIFKDEHIIFDQVTDAWKMACQKELGFEIPVYEPIEIDTGDDATESDVETDEASTGS